MVGDVGCKIGPGAVSLLQWPVGIVPEAGRAKQKLIAGLPVRRIHTLRTIQRSSIHQLARLQVRNGFLHAPGLLKLSLGHEQVHPNTKRCEVVPDFLHHCGHCEAANGLQPLRFRTVPVPLPDRVCQRPAHRPEIVPGIGAGRELDGLSKSLPVAKMCGPGKCIHLGTGVVHVVLPGRAPATERQKRSQGRRRKLPRGHGPHAEVRSDSWRQTPRSRSPRHPGPIGHTPTPPTTPFG